MKKKSQDVYHWHYSSPPPKMPWKPTTLKQKALWVFALIFWLIGALTFFAIKTEEQMTPQVTTMQAETSYSAGSQAKLPLSCLQADDDGGVHLYQIYEGTGWEAGIRVQEVQDFSLDENNVILNSGWGEYVQYASKPLTAGGLVDVIRGGDKAPDYWLAVFPEDVPELGDLGNSVEIAAQNKNAVRLSVESDTQPFMEGRAKSSVSALAGARVYSLANVEQFLGNFVCSSLLLAIFAIVFTLWGYAWIGSKPFFPMQAIRPLTFQLTMITVFTSPKYNAKTVLTLENGCLPLQFYQRFVQFFVKLLPFIPVHS